MNIHLLAAKAADKQPLSWPEARFLAHTPPTETDRLCRAAHAIKEQFFGSSFGFCAIISAKGGPCSENCSFCAQSGHHDTEPIPTFDFLPLETILSRAKTAKAAGATRFSLVTSGKAPNGAEFDLLLKGIEGVQRLGLQADVSPGMLSYTQLAALKQAGAGAYHHNLETGPSYFPVMCTSHEYEENVTAVRHAVELGLETCVGGIFGIGESWDDRIELALVLRELGVSSVPINFLHPIKGTPLQNQPVLGADEALKIIALYRFLLPDTHIRICGGRHTVFSPKQQKRVFTSGASGVMIGDYLTIKGKASAADAALARKLGLETNHCAYETRNHE